MLKVELVTGDVTFSSGKVLTQDDFERMADEAEVAEFDVEAIAARAVRRGPESPLC